MRACFLHGKTYHSISMDLLYFCLESFYHSGELEDGPRELYLTVYRCLVLGAESPGITRNIFSSRRPLTSWVRGEVLSDLITRYTRSKTILSVNGLGEKFNLTIFNYTTLWYFIIFYCHQENKIKQRTQIIIAVTKKFHKGLSTILTLKRIYTSMDLSKVLLYNQFSQCHSLHVLPKFTGLTSWGICIP